MVEGTEHLAAHADDDATCAWSADQWLSHARRLVPTALEMAKNAQGFTGRWKAIAHKLERLPPCLSDLSSHPFFAKNALCGEQLHSVCQTVSEAIQLAARCGGEGAEPPRFGKLQMQSDLDSLAGKLDLNLRDCGLLIRTGLLGEITQPPPLSSVPSTEREATTSAKSDVCELFARLQIGNSEAKHRAVDGLLEVINEDEKTVLSALGRSNISALVQLLTDPSTKIREKAVAVLCLIVESGAYDALLISQGALSPLIRLAESGNAVCREKVATTLQRLSLSSDTSRLIVAHGGVSPLIEICRTGDSISQASAAGTLKNLSVVAELRQSLADEGAIELMVDLLDCGIVMSSKEYAADCLQNLTASSDSLRRAVVSEGGVRSLLAYLDGPLPQESAVGALSNLVSSVSSTGLISMGLLPRLVHVLKAGSLNAQQAAASVICTISGSSEMKKLIGECGYVPLLVSMLEAKTDGAREAAARAISCLMGDPQNARDVKKDDRAVPYLVHLLDPCPQNTAKKYAVSCLLPLSASRKCRRWMISYGAIGYLKKLSEMDVPGSKKLLGRLERGKLRGLLSKK